MRTTKVVQQDVEVTDDILCNKCGQSLMRPHGYGPFGLAEAEVEGGFGSAPLRDCTTYTFSLCETCLVELFGTFKIPVKVVCRLD